MSAALRVEQLAVAVEPAQGGYRLVHDVSFEIARGETLAIVGESGCGKSMTALALMRLLPAGVEIASGHVFLDGDDLPALDETRLCAIRGKRMAMIFQEPLSALNPVLTVGDQIAEAIRAHRSGRASNARAQAQALLAQVRIPDAKGRLDAYPHQLSGGMRQRVMIAMALAGDPSVLVADEPTTALDVTIQAQILELLAEIQRVRGLALVLITHDLGVVRTVADRMLVMYAGRIVEEGRVDHVLAQPAHPYTIGLLGARPGSAAATRARTRLREIPGVVPPADAPPSGCAFAPRCDRSIERCGAGVPVSLSLSTSHRAACIRVTESSRVQP